jgi:hypothetical protein
MDPDFDLSADEDEGGEDGSAFMSLLNSYYDAPDTQGGAETSSSSNQPSGELIDTPHFQPDNYVKVVFIIFLRSVVLTVKRSHLHQSLLKTKPMEVLIKTDNDMIHEIKVDGNYV